MISFRLLLIVTNLLKRHYIVGRIVMKLTNFLKLRKHDENQRIVIDGALL